MNPSNEELALEALKIELLYKQGISYLNKGNYNSAIVLFSRAIESTKYVVALDLYMARALCHMNNGDYIDALKDYLNPLFNTRPDADSNIIRLTNIGYAYYRLGIYSEARNYYKKVLIINPNDSDAINILEEINN